MRYLVQMVLAAAAAVAAVLCWLQVRSLVDVGPVADGQQGTVSVVYDPPLMALGLAFATAAGVLAVLAVAGVRRRRGAEVIRGARERSR